MSDGDGDGEKDSLGLLDTIMTFAYDKYFK